MARSPVIRLAAALAGACVLGATTALPAQQTQATTRQASPPRRFSIPIDYYTLANGLKVVLSRDTTSPSVFVAVYYGVGFRNEPRDRSGFSHLFEHLMFQGSQNLGKMEFMKLIQNNGGDGNATTGYDHTDYLEVVPSNTLEMVLWAEADRMKGPVIDTTRLANQRDVVKNELRAGALSAPYRSLVLLAMLANTRWQNARNFMNDFADLDAVSVSDAEEFFRTYYAPNNAVLVVVGDVDRTQARDWIAKYFAAIPRGAPPPAPDLSEPPQLAERRGSKVDSLAPQPAIGIAYHLPVRNSPEWYAFGLLEQILAQGQDSRLYHALVRTQGLTNDIATFNTLDRIHWVNGPMLWRVSAILSTTASADSFLTAFERVLAPLRDAPVDQATIDRAVLKFRSSLYHWIEDASDIGRAGLLAVFALFDDDPDRINRLEFEFANVTPALLQKTAQEYLIPSNRTVLTILPGAVAPVSH